MLKKDMQKKITQLEMDLNKLRRAEKHTAEMMSKVLGSFKSGISMYRDREEVDVLSWKEIFFEIGKVVESANRLRSIEQLHEKIESQNRVVEQVHLAWRKMDEEMNND